MLDVRQVPLRAEIGFEGQPFERQPRLLAELPDARTQRQRKGVRLSSTGHAGRLWRGRPRRVCRDKRPKSAHRNLVCLDKPYGQSLFSTFAFAFSSSGAATCQGGTPTGKQYRRRRRVVCPTSSSSKATERVAFSPSRKRRPPSDVIRTATSYCRIRQSLGTTPPSSLPEPSSWCATSSPATGPSWGSIA